MSSLLATLVFLYVAGLVLAVYAALLIDIANAARARRLLDWSGGYRGRFTWITSLKDIPATALTYEGIPFIVDPYCPKDTIYLMNLKAMEWDRWPYITP